jgi:hypothetical protein
MNDAIASEAIGETGTVQNLVREVVGVFDSPAHLEAAVEQLGIAGVDRAAMSVLGAEGTSPGEPRKEGADAAPRSVLEISDDPTTPTTAFVSDISWNEARGMVTAVPLVIGGFGAAWAVAAAGGALLFAIGATVASGAVGAGFGALLYHAVARHHAAAIRDQMARGGLILWVRVADTEAEERALAVLRARGAGFVHTHTIDRPWGVANSPLNGVQPDPFLGHDPSADPA